MAAWFVVGVLLAVPAVASASYNVTLSTSATSNGSFVVDANGLATFTPTANDAVLSVNDLGSELASHDVVVGTGSSGTQSGNITFGTGIGSKSTHSLSFTPGASGATTVVRFANPFNSGSNFAAFTGAINIGGALTMNGATVLDLTNSSAMVTAASQSYKGSVSVKSASVLSSSGAISFSSTIDSAGTTPEQLSATGSTVSFGGNVGATNALSSLSVSAFPVSLGANVTTTGDQTYGSVTLTANATLSVTGTGNVGLGAVDGAHSLTVKDSSGTATIGAIGSSTQLTSLDLAGTGIQLNGNAKTTGSQSYEGPVTLAGAVSQSLTQTTGSASISFSSTLKSTNSIPVTVTTSSGLVFFNGAVTLDGSLSVTHRTVISGGSVTTGGPQTYGDVVALRADTTMTPGSQGIDFQGSVDGGTGPDSSSAASLTLKGPANFEQGVGNGFGAPLRDLNAGTVTVNGAVHTWGSQYYAGPVTLGGDTTFDADYSFKFDGFDDSVYFANTIDGAHSLNFAPEHMDISFAGAVGSTTPPKSLSMWEGYPVAVSADVTTSGDQTWGFDNGGTTNVSQDVTFTSKAGNLNMDGLSGNGNVTLDPASGKAVSFNVGNDANHLLGGLTVNGPVTLPTVAANFIGTKGDQVYNGPVTVPSAESLSSTTGHVTFASTVDSSSAGAAPLTVAANQGAVFDAAVGGTYPLSTLDTSGSSSTTFNIGSISVTKDEKLSPLNLNNDFTLTPPGTLSLSSGNGSLGSHTLTVDGGATMAASESGTGGVIKKGTGTLTLSGANTYSGTTSVTAGTLATGATNALSPNSTISLGSDPSVLLSLGGFDQSIPALTGAGTVQLGSNTLTVGAGNASSSYAGTIKGTGTLRKAGVGTFTIKGSNAGTTAIGAGTLDNEALLGPVTLDGGTLSGAGSTGAITQGAGGTIDPGSGSGTANVATGDLLLNNLTTLATTLGGDQPGSGYDQLSTTGGVSLGGTSLNLVVNPGYTPPPATPFVIISNDGADAVAGTFHNLPEGATINQGALRFTVSYKGGDGNDVTLTRVLQTPLMSFGSSTYSTTAGAPVTLTAALGPQAPETSNPTGTVTFLDGTQTIGTGVLGNGTANVTTSSLGAGAHTITARYGGDLTFGSLTSSPVTVTVQGGGGGGGGGSSPPPSTSQHAPVLSGLGQTHARWRRGSKLASLSAAKKKPPVGTMFTFRLNEAATVSFSFARAGGRPLVLRLSGHAGSDRMSFQGRISSGQKLAPGRYTVTVIASAQGLSSAPQRLTFTIAG